jgi:hypothetical protein
MAKNARKSLIKNISSNKTFSYSKGSCSLNFNLQVNNSSELKDFKSLMEQGICDINDILKGMVN